jgi:hypothetical protein
MDQRETLFYIIYSISASHWSICLIGYDARYTHHQIRVIKLRSLRWIGHVACIGENKNAMSTNLVARPEGKGPLGRARHRW